MGPCPGCGHPPSARDRFCTQCGTALVTPPAAAAQGEDLYAPVLYAMAAPLVAALVIPPWETPPGEAPLFLGFHVLLSPPVSPSGSLGIVSRLLLTVELVMIAVGGLYLSWLLRRRPRGKSGG